MAPPAKDREMTGQRASDLRVMRSTLRSSSDPGSVPRSTSPEAIWRSQDSGPAPDGRGRGEAKRSEPYSGRLKATVRGEHRLHTFGWGRIADREPSPKADRKRRAGRGAQCSSSAVDVGRAAPCREASGPARGEGALTGEHERASDRGSRPPGRGLHIPLQSASSSPCMSEGRGDRGGPSRLPGRGGRSDHWRPSDMSLRAHGSRGDGR